MLAARWAATALTILTLGAVPVAGQQTGQDTAAAKQRTAQGMMPMAGTMPMAGRMMGGGMMGMMRMMMSRNGVAAGAAMGSGGVMGMMSGGMMGGGGLTGRVPGTPLGPRALLERSAALELTAEQTDSLRSLAETAAEADRQHAQAAAAARQTAAAALQGEPPDVEAYGTALREAADHMIDARIAAVRAGFDARAVLTPDQRGLLETTGAGSCPMIGRMMNQGTVGAGSSDSEGPRAPHHH